MSGVKERRIAPRPAPTSVDWGQRFARLLCLLFALIGLVPLSGGLLLRSAPVKQWAANETSRLLWQHLGMSATFQVELSLIPLRLEISDLAVADTERPEPAIEAELVAISPRFFSLLAGRIDVGDIELENSSLHLNVQGGKVRNIALRVPTDNEPTPELTRSPFRTLAITNASVEVTVDQQKAQVQGIDLDVIAEKDLTFDLALRAIGAHIKTTHPREAPETASSDPAAPGTPALDDPTIGHDEDELCALELRAEISKHEINVTRLSLLASLDNNPSSQVGARCAGDPAHQLALRLSQFQLIPNATTDGVERVRGNVMFKAPLFVIDRLKSGLSAEGWAGYSGAIAWNQGDRLPEITGKISGEHMHITKRKISDQLSADLVIANDTIIISRMDAAWGNGQSTFSDIVMRPFAEGLPFEIGHISTHGIDLPGVLRDIDITPHAWVDWNFADTEVDKVKGTISPFYLDGGVDGHTKGFVVWDRGFDDPARRNMLGIPQAHVKGRFRAHGKALEFYNCDLRFGTSHVPVDLVSIGFYPTALIVRTKPEGGNIDLADLGPIADLPLTGKSQVFADLKGPMTHPTLKGTLKVDDLTIGGFNAGDVKQADVHFEPLFVEFGNLQGRKGKMDFRLPKARLSFDGPAAVEFSTGVESEHFSLAEFLDVFHFNDDPRFSDLLGEGKVKGKVRYLLGGPDDPCGGGRLWVDGSAQLTSAVFLGERYSGGNGDFSLDWFDIDAGLRGLSLYVPTLMVRKGTGSVFGAITVQAEGRVTGDLVGTQIPVSHIDLLGPDFSQFDGFVSGSGQLSGSLEELEVNAQLDVSELKVVSASFPPSQLTLQLRSFAMPVPAPSKNAPAQEKTGCGRVIPGPYVPTEGQVAGDVTLNGQLLGGQIQLNDLSLTQQADPRLKGSVEFKELDIAELEGLFLVPGRSAYLTSGTISGKLTIDEFLVNAPFSSRARLQVDKVSLKSETLSVDLAEQPFFLNLDQQQIKSENLILSAKAKAGQSGLIDAAFLIDSSQKLNASLKLRPTSLGVLTAITPTISRAEGELSAELNVTGPLNRPVLRGAIDVRGGIVQLKGIAEPLEQLNLHADLDQQGIHLNQGRGQFGGGDLTFKGELPLSEGSLGELDLGILARRVHYRPEPGVQVTFDADLKLTALRTEGEVEKLPAVSGTFDVLSANYDKPMSITADISTLTTRGDKTEITGYDVGKDNLELDLLIRSTRPLSVNNELVRCTLRLDPGGLRITGTDQRFGAVGTVEVQSGGRIFLRRNEFETKSGLVRFNDPTRLKPEVDVSAVTEYRRYNKVGSSQSQTSSGDAGSSTVGSGNWRILLHAYGPPDNLKVDLTSDPPLDQDDIFLLLTVGLTRTELDQSRSAGVGSSVALEALGTLSGAESAVTDIVPVDEFRFGSTFSSRSGRTEPTVTIGKRLSNRIRASVTTSLSETSEVRSNVEYQATQNLSVEGSYDNARNVASAAGGNLGGDVRWRVEFR